MSDPTLELLFCRRGCLSLQQKGPCDCGCAEALDHYRKVLARLQDLMDRKWNEEALEQMYDDCKAERDKAIELMAAKMEDLNPCGKTILDLHAVWMHQAKKRINEQSQQIEKWEAAYQRLRDEHAETILRLQKAVGGCGLTEYQPEADLEIEGRIESIKAERDRLREEATHKCACVTDGQDEIVQWCAVHAAIRDERDYYRKALEDKP